MTGRKLCAYAIGPILPEGSKDVADSKLGTKRIDPETGRKFYDLNRDPIVSPYTGVAYPRSYFDAGTVSAREEEEEVEERETETEEAATETVSLEDADEEAKEGGDLPDLGDEEEDIDLGEDAEDTFLEDEEEEGDDVSGILGVDNDDEG